MDYLEIEATRGDPWRDTIEFVYAGTLPLDGATIDLQWRQYEGQPGAALYSITGCPYTDAWASTYEIAAGDAREGDRILRLMIDGPVVPTDLPTGLNQPEAGEADRYVWDAAIIQSGSVVMRPFGGHVFVNKGVTRP